MTGHKLSRYALWSLAWAVGTCGVIAAADVPPDAAPVQALSSDGVAVWRREHSLWLRLGPAALEKQQATIPRLCAPIRSLGWSGHADAALKFQPEPRNWVFSWSDAPASATVIEVVFDAPPTLPDDGRPAMPAGDGSVLLHACQADTVGEKLRYEPQWFKNTVGYWTVPTDYASWRLSIDQPGSYSVAVLQGCGAGQGGSEALLSLRRGESVDTQLEFQTIETGHFQNFRWVHLGHVALGEPGAYELRIEPRRIAKNALCDIRAVHLVRQAKELDPQAR